jgi:hypothetical protein
MGLDMYLYRKEYISGTAWTQDEKAIKEANLYSVIADHFDIPSNGSHLHAEIDICVAYWRKANAIHGWFVNTLAGGVDECQPIYVSLDNLKELRELVNSVLLTPAFAGDILPTQSGFFFGSSDIDEWYISDMKNTVEMIDKIISSVSPDSYNRFYYQASW